MHDKVQWLLFSFFLHQGSLHFNLKNNKFKKVSLDLFYKLTFEKHVNGENVDISVIYNWSFGREREMFYLTTHSTHFIYGYMASDIWLRTILIVRKETCCRHIGYSYRLIARVLLYAPSHRQDNTYQGLCYTSRGALAGTRNSSMGPPHEGSTLRPIAPWANALPLSYVPLPTLEDTEPKPDAMAQWLCHRLISSYERGFKGPISCTPSSLSLRLNFCPGQTVDAPRTGHAWFWPKLQEKSPFQLTFDNLFTSLKLIDCLTSKNIRCTGTIRSNIIKNCPLTSIKQMKKLK